MHLNTSDGSQILPSPLPTCQVWSKVVGGKFLRNCDIFALSLSERSVRNLVIKSRLLHFSFSRADSQRFCTDARFATSVNLRASVVCLNLSATAVRVNSRGTAVLLDLSSIFLTIPPRLNMDTCLTFDDALFESGCVRLIDEVASRKFISSNKKNLRIPTNCLQNVRKLDLSWCAWVKDIQSLSNLHTLNLTGCNGVSDVQILSNVHCLCLKYCKNVRDVRGLQRVHSLDLSYCEQVTDVSCLGNVHSLNLTSCQGVTDVSSLNQVHSLVLANCLGVTDVSLLGDLYSLELSNCSGVTHVNQLGNVCNLVLSGCKSITDVSCLGNVHTLNISGCIGVTNVRTLGNVHTLDITNCRGVTDVSFLGNVQILIADKNEKFNTFWECNIEQLELVATAFGWCCCILGYVQLYFLCCDLKQFFGL